MLQTLPDWLRMAAATLLACAVCYRLTPAVKILAETLGAVDQPGGRRIHDHPIPRMGGLAICLAFLSAALLLARLSRAVVGTLLGALIIALMGAADDLVQLSPRKKLAVQCAAALTAMACGVRIEFISTPAGAEPFLALGKLSGPLTLLWLVGCTNAVNLIDGLDGLAAGVSAISSLTLFEAALLAGQPNAALLLAALTGACLGFLPYNFHPAVIFMGDLGSQFLGFVLACVSVIGAFKLQTALTFAVPVLSLALPLADTVCSFFRRLLHGQSPFHADRGHFHHRLLALGFSQKQAAAVLYAASALSGLAALCLADRHRGVRLACLLLGWAIVFCLDRFVLRRTHRRPKGEKGG
ncbi:MAG: undecaprenyl/decaprenyl-phosphate alpha-N-acetylglucosaminyl 1-phosphate transferase [Oscillospiraceae bacterium]|nr:undecaprenyl/decaprenyl-phosphate alpha-N-acetylglucosaminyl 1-phosphate transferase [Oscillospiraceae bacterium]